MSEEVEIPTADDMLKHHEYSLAEMPPELIKRAVEHLHNEIPYHIQADLVKSYEQAKHKGAWFSGEHFFYGMAVRNELRQTGILDEQLPSGNWDDYYLPCLEIAIGVRRYPGIEFKKVAPEEFFCKLIDPDKYIGK